MFFFQAEDGIRDLTVTGVQTCALPISVGERVLRSAHHDQARDEERGVAHAFVHLHASFQRLSENDQVESRAQHRRGDGLHAHFPEAQQLLEEQRPEAGHDCRPVSRRNTSSRSGGCTSSSTMPMALSRSLASTASSSRALARRSEEHTSELQSQSNLVCRLLLEKKKKRKNTHKNHKTRKCLTCTVKH